ncbi:HTH_Tnp_Tc3_2 domain-containing protein [Trichonephila clavipes]|nr:HTH_Tnp_Tc3_2 domain-containing protein [Trichonephila clavipes]
MGRSDAAIKRCGQKWVDSGRFQRHDGSCRPMDTADQEDRLITANRAKSTLVPTATLRPITPTHFRAGLQWLLARSGWNHADWGRTMFSDDSCFQLCLNDHRRRVWRQPRQHADHAFTITCHIGHQQLVIV